MILFFVSVGMLLLGYFVYGAFVDRIFAADPTKLTPAITMEDGLDYIKMPTWKIFLIQFLNIAGLGPIYGPITLTITHKGNDIAVMENVVKRP